MDKREWKCPECNQVGRYLDIRKPIDKGVDCCLDCGAEVKCIECDVCLDTFLVCENHEDKVWNEEYGGCECGAGMPCKCAN